MPEVDRRSLSHTLPATILAIQLSRKWSVLQRETIVLELDHSELSLDRPVIDYGILE